jgi:hypothetical protein
VIPVFPSVTDLRMDHSAARFLFAARLFSRIARRAFEYPTVTAARAQRGTVANQLGSSAPEVASRTPKPKQAAVNSSL